MKQNEYIPKIVSLITRLRQEVDSLNQARLFDINIQSESFVKDLFNLIFPSYELENINIVKGIANFSAIDLGDETNKIAIQVTSNADGTKIATTIEKFIEKELYKKFTKLIIFSITKKKATKLSFDTKGQFTFNSNTDIQDFNDLIKIIISLSAAKQKEILDFLESEIGEASSTSKVSRPSEVETILELIEYLSSEKNLNDIREPLDPDPQGKIYKRFSDYSGFLENEIKTYIPRYEAIRLEAEKVLGLDGAKVTWIRTALQVLSERLLREKQNDPKAALDALVDYFDNKLSIRGRTYDQGAIRYYLLHELIECNVFPDTAIKQ
ncbi:MAG: SMEK domain-containing protein [Candidatus Gottesmanbacteria bacterium]|nr:SMEK domain-containing protein [Candidatus Gottesmanbacteria bacterium]